MNARSCGVGGGGAISGLLRSLFHLKHKLWATLLLIPFLGLAQVTITEVDRSGDGTLRLMFRAEDMVSTNYTIEYRPDFSATNVWNAVQDARLQSVGGDTYQLDLQSVTNQAGYYRILSPEALRAWFESTTVNVNEGTGELDLLVRLNGHFRGMLQYSVEGTGTASVDGLTGDLAVDGTSATIRLTLNDNASIDQLRYLSIRLLGAPGLEVGSRAAATVNIEENDSVWRGMLDMDTGAPGFQLELIESPSGVAAQFSGGEFGLFPTNSLAATVDLSETRFTADVAGIPISAESSLMGVPIDLSLHLIADEQLVGGGVQSVGEDVIEGIGTLIMELPTLPHLNSTNHGTFVLQRPAVSPSSDEVELLNAP